MDEHKNTILAFLKTQHLGTVATVHVLGEKPEAATVGFAETEALEIIFGTFNDSRKYTNLEHNKHVAFVFAEKNISVQYEGVAHLLEGEEADEAKAMFIKKNPRAARVLNDSRERLIKITPTWIRYTDANVEPVTIFEVSFEPL
jgi:general stress protein 26